ncbi:MAG: neutral zinc metallopeptidase [Caulobacteraceae bacterium]|nr:neutral zinc metallopeptidase [Caulobacteraceae bacterium]
MRWQDGQGSGHVEDRRGLGPVGGIGIGGIILAIIGYAVFGIEPEKTMSVLNEVTGEPQQGQVGTPNDEQGRFVDTILASTEQVWSAEFRKAGMEYRPTTTVLYTGGTMTGCGVGQAAVGPFYCPQDQKVYLDLSFFQQLDQEFGAPGDFARAYVIAHEVGHHVQLLTGVSAEVEQRMQAAGSEAEANSWSVRLELQADCYAGVWARQSNEARNWLEAGDLEEGLRAAAAVGDDTLQSRAQGQVAPDSFTHGSSEQRVRWFTRGYESGDSDACDTFSSARL